MPRRIQSKPGRALRLMMETKAVVHVRLESTARGFASWNALLIGYESLERLIYLVSIAFNQAIPIAAVGLGVNLLSAFLLRDDHHQGHAHDHDHARDNRHDDHDHARGRGNVHRDHNLRAAFVHVVADAAVSVLVIVGLVAGRQFGWVWMALTPLVEPLSIDEAFLDLSGTERLHGLIPAQVLARFAADVEEKLRITVSIGLS